MPLAELTTGRVQAMFTAIIRARSRQGRPISGATLQRIRGVLHAALNAAIRRELLTRNPAHWIELPAARRPRAVVWTDARVEHWRATGERPRVAVWTPEQTAAFLAHLQGREHYVLFLLVALLGLRRGEAAGLRWCDVDLAKRELSVSHQVQDHNGQTVICPPKTEHSVRTLALARFATTALRELRSARRRRLPGGQEPTGFIFTNPSGKPWSPGYLTHTFRRLVAEADLPPIRLHDLRHGAASLSLAAGNELKIVQAMLGHSSIVFTADTYVSVEPCLAHKAAEATATLVLRAARRDSLRIRGVRPKRRRRHRSRAVTKKASAHAA